MRAVELTLLSYTYDVDNIGQQIKKERKETVPIIKETSILLEEFYEANKQGIRPELRIIISSLSYHGENEFIYMGDKYSIIRTSTPNVDEVAIIARKKVGDVIEKV